MSKEHRLAIRLDEGDDAWLAEQEEELGLGKADIVRMMIRRARKAGKPLFDAPQSVYRAEPIYHQPDEYDQGETDEQEIDPAVVEDLVASRMAEAKVEPAPAAPVNGYGFPQGSVRPISLNKKQSGKDWMRT